MPYSNETTMEERMKSRITAQVTLVVVLSLNLSTCAPAAPDLSKPTMSPQQAAALAVPIETALDAGYTAFLERMDNYNALTIDSFAEMQAEDPAPFLLDVRQPDEAERSGHIPGAVLIPVRELGKNLDKLPSFDTTIVSYCGSGWRCTIAMTALGGLGWEHIYTLKDGSFGGYVRAGYEVAPGLPDDAPALNAASPDPALVAVIDEALSNIPNGWGAISPTDLATELAENPDLILIDNRKPAEVEKDGLIEADHRLAIPLEDFIAMRADWPSDKDAPIVTYSGSGHRCTMAMTILWSYGYTDVRSLLGGLGAWVDAGYPVVEPTTQ
jgi:rhodanese-related sulfurtransferase